MNPAYGIGRGGIANMHDPETERALAVKRARQQAYAEELEKQLRLQGKPSQQSSSPYHQQQQQHGGEHRNRRESQHRRPSGQFDEALDRRNSQRKDDYSTPQRRGPERGGGGRSRGRSRERGGYNNRRDEYEDRSRSRERNRERYEQERDYINRRDSDPRGGDYRDRDRDRDRGGGRGGSGYRGRAPPVRARRLSDSDDDNYDYRRDRDRGGRFRDIPSSRDRNEGRPPRGDYNGGRGGDRGQGNGNGNGPIDNSPAAQKRRQQIEYQRVLEHQIAERRARVERENGPRAKAIVPGIDASRGGLTPPSGAFMSGMRDLRAGLTAEQYLKQKESAEQYKRELSAQIKAKEERQRAEKMRIQDLERKHEERFMQSLEQGNKEADIARRGSFPANKEHRKMMEEKAAHQNMRPPQLNTEWERNPNAPQAPLSPGAKAAQAVPDQNAPIAGDGLFGDPKQKDKSKNAKLQWQQELEKQIAMKEEVKRAKKQKEAEEEAKFQAKLERQRQEMEQAYRRETGKEADKASEDNNGGVMVPDKPRPNRGGRDSAAANDETKRGGPSRGGGGRNSRNRGGGRTERFDATALSVSELRRENGEGRDSPFTRAGDNFDRARTKVFGDEIEELKYQLRRDQQDLKARLNEQDDLINILKRDAEEKRVRGRDRSPQRNRLLDMAQDQSYNGGKFQGDITLPHASRMLPIEDSLTALEQTVKVGSGGFAGLANDRGFGSTLNGNSQFIYGGAMDANYDELFDDRRPKKGGANKGGVTLDLDKMGRNNMDAYARLEHMDERDALGLSVGFKNEMAGLIPTVVHSTPGVQGEFGITANNDELLRRFANQTMS